MYAVIYIYIYIMYAVIYIYTHIYIYIHALCHKCRLRQDAGGEVRQPGLHGARAAPAAEDYTMLY